MTFNDPSQWPFEYSFVRFCPFESVVKASFFRNEMETNRSKIGNNSVSDYVYESGSGSSIDYDLFQKYDRNRAVGDTTYWTLIIAYSVLIVAGSIGNLLVILAVANNKS